MKKIGLFMGFCLIILDIVSAQIPLPKDLPPGHPRLMVTDSEKENLQEQIEKEAWAQDVMQGIHNRIGHYVDQHVVDSTWMPSRLMMYWKSHATNVYIKGGVYSHADGEAPVPTVRFGSTRGVGSPIKRPKLEDIIPYMDDTKGVCFHNTAKEGSPLEWVDQSGVSGMNIESVNNEILRLGRDAAFVYWLTNDDKYGKFAYDVFNTYMTGMYYRNEPIDLGNGHAQTLVGMSTFEVIQEHILPDLAAYYDFLYPYIRAKHADKIEVFEAAFKKWIDVTVKNGVPHNNWNLHQANIILGVAMVLDDNSAYADGKGREYYINQILNQSVPRQWSISKLMQYGYDFDNGIWNECPGYAQSVTREFMHFIQNYDNTFHQNLLPYTPVMKKAVEVLPQYLFPNGKITAFGDSYYSDLNIEPIASMIRMSQKYGNIADEQKFTEMYRLFEPNVDVPGSSSKLSPQVSSFFTQKPLELDSTGAKGEVGDYLTQTFYAPNVSWFVQRNGFLNKEHGLMISQVASYGNHAHANGISMELYGKGFVLGPESGIGSSYFEKPYLEYYSQFPAHNTVMVDGISSYPEMLSHHSFDLLNCYPQSGQKDGFYPDITFSEVYFLEPESQSDQKRLLSIIRTSETTGYYIDIFRSKKQRKDDKFHDYFYHNLGQKLHLSNTQGQEFDLQASDEMAFAGGHLFALDYMWDKKSIKTDQDYQAVWKMTMPDSNHVYMNLWMKGYPDREVFSIKAPPTKAFRGNHDIPYKVDETPFLTIAARQHGEAWSHPFVSVFEPATEQEPVMISRIESFDVQGITDSFVGLKIESLEDRTDYVFSSDEDHPVVFQNLGFCGTYGVVTTTGSETTLFLGNGKSISKGNLKLETENGPGSAAATFAEGNLLITADTPIVLTLEDNYPKGKLMLKAGEFRLEGQRTKAGKQKVVSFNIPEISHQKVKIQTIK
ncbi:hypothetical protein [Gaoshiqia sp. Z1-71]|uniref:hypothetical protein n=1 Tax=Gaoshiqia hydrogeniformans TaxID=3290090 RepID=UPI003BF780EB